MLVITATGGPETVLAWSWAGLMAAGMEQAAEVEIKLGPRVG